jgi:hypothetical protein
MMQFGGEEDFFGGPLPGLEGDDPEPNFMNPDGSVDSTKLLEYLRSVGVEDLSDIMGGGTPGEYDLTIDGPNRDSPLAQIYASIIGPAEGVDPSVLADEQGRTGFINTGMGEVAQQIADAGGYENWLLLQAEEEEVVDPNQSTLPVDTVAEGEGEEEEGEEEGEGESLLDRLGNWWEGVMNSVGGSVGGGGSTPPTLPGGAGVIIGGGGTSWPNVLSQPGGWRVFLPGMIPGLPQSPTIIGTIEDILNSPGQVLGDLWDRVENAVANPGEFLEGLLNGVIDEDGNVTVGGISAVVGSIYDDLFGDDPVDQEETGEEDTTVGGSDDTLEFDEEQPRGGVDDDVIYGDPNEEEEQLPGSGDSEESAGGGGRGGFTPGGNSRDYGYRLQYNPDAPMSVPGGMLTEAPQRRKLRAPELGQPSMVQGLLLGRT